jgi:hypothetical protein
MNAETSEVLLGVLAWFVLPATTILLFVLFVRWIAKCVIREEQQLFKQTQLPTPPDSQKKKTSGKSGKGVFVPNSRWTRISRS